MSKDCQQIPSLPLADIELVAVGQTVVAIEIHLA
jgi:hypothetical protein